MLAGGQFSKSRKHAVWLPSFLKRFDPDTLRYYLSINMPEAHDTDFNWPDFVEKINSELIAAYGNFVHRVLTLVQDYLMIDRCRHLTICLIVQMKWRNWKHYINKQHQVLKDTDTKRHYEP